MCAAMRQRVKLADRFVLWNVSNFLLLAVVSLRPISPTCSSCNLSWYYPTSDLCRPDAITERKKWSHLDLKSWVTVGTKIWPGIPSNCIIFESNWLYIESPFKLTHLKKISQIYVSIYMYIFILALNIYSIWLKYSPITRNPGSNFSSANDSIF